MITGRLLIEQIINGLVSGCMYAIVASGLTLIWGTMKMLNFAHGQFYMIGGYILFFCMTFFGIPPVFSILFAIAVTFALGLLIERLIIHPLLDKPDWQSSAFVITLGVSIFLQNLAQKIWGEKFKSVPYFLNGVLDVYGFRIAYQRMFIFTVTAVVMISLWWFIKKSKFGLGLRATAQDRDSALLVGINAKIIYMATFGIRLCHGCSCSNPLSSYFSDQSLDGKCRLVKGIYHSSAGRVRKLRRSDSRRYSPRNSRKFNGGSNLFGVERCSGICDLNYGSCHSAFGSIRNEGMVKTMIFWSANPVQKFKVESSRAYLIAIILLILFPVFIRDPYILNVLIIALIFSVLAASWNLISGYTGILTFGHQAFFGIGAYFSALLAMKGGVSPWFGLLVGGIVAAVFGFLIGLPCLRLRAAPYIATTTLALAEIARVTCMN